MQFLRKNVIVHPLEGIIGLNTTTRAGNDNNQFTPIIGLLSNWLSLPCFSLVISTVFMKQNLRKLSLMPTGSFCVIESFTDEALKQKLLEMGCLPGETIQIDRLAPLGCPMAIVVSGATLSIRKDEADHILVKPIA